MKYYIFICVEIKVQFFLHILTFVRDLLSKVLRVSCAVNFQSFGGQLILSSMRDVDGDDGENYYEKG